MRVPFTVPGGADGQPTKRAALSPGGRLVVHAVTLDSERIVADSCVAYGGELTRIAVESAAPIGSFTGWTPARTVTQWALAR